MSEVFTKNQGKEMIMPRKKKVADEAESGKGFEECFFEAQAILNLNHDILAKYVSAEPNIKKKQKALDKIDKILTLANELYNQ